MMPGNGRTSLGYDEGVEKVQESRLITGVYCIFLGTPLPDASFFLYLLLYLISST
jgi:hypothetical protein